MAEGERIERGENERERLQRRGYEENHRLELLVWGIGGRRRGRCIFKVGGIGGISE